MHDSKFEMVMRRVTTVLSVVILTLTLTSAITGILLSFYYEPAAGKAFESLKVIDTEVAYGWLFHKFHQIAGHAVIAIALIQIVAMFISRQFQRNWLTAWISGIFFTLSAMALSWTAIILSWDQEGFWRFNIELKTIQAIPLIGNTLRDVLTGGGAVNTTTVQHLYTLHSYVASVAAVALAVVHLISLLRQEKQRNLEAMPSAEVQELQQQPANS